MIEIKLTFTTAAAAAAALALLNSDTVAVKHDTPSGTVKPKAEPTKPAPEKTEPVKVEPAKVEPVKVEKAEPETPAAAAKVEYKDVQAAVMKLAAIGANEDDEAKQVGRAAVKAVLKKLGLESFKGSPEGCWGTAIAELTAAHAKLTA